MENGQRLVERLANAKNFIIVDIKNGKKYTFTQDFVSIGNSKGERTLTLILKGRFRNKKIKFKSIEKILSFFYALQRNVPIILKTGDREIKISKYRVVVTVPGIIVGQRGEKQWMIAIDE